MILKNISVRNPYSALRCCAVRLNIQYFQTIMYNLVLQHCWSYMFLPLEGGTATSSPLKFTTEKTGSQVQFIPVSLRAKHLSVCLVETNIPVTLSESHLNDVIASLFISFCACAWPADFLFLHQLHWRSVFWKHKWLIEIRMRLMVWRHCTSCKEFNNSARNIWGKKEETTQEVWYWVSLASQWQVTRGPVTEKWP